ncbi:MAG TPA: UDP-N-acetylmuramoylalanyl-D-glutamyl-2,6-diaminopimelate--D-alanyl-D-alanine ligase [Xanthobacteraceae bacterium]|nr:UDP-N-acetylmuramoylalanyl-D-glutamyl-2,6-diaminopimelate--D-alanyl-D-alanine ligase [Xanthobacteraceae bacterium]
MSAPALWTTKAMAEAMAAQRQGSLPDSVPGLSIDTRSLAPGEAFFAIAGENRDGHDFVAAALTAKAGLAVVAADRRRQFPGDAPLLVVPNVLAGLRDLAAAARARTTAKVIGVTGSVGKTGTKEALRLALSKDGETHASVASYNNQWGVPLSLARCPASARYAVLEMGMNHEGEIEPLSRLVRPQVAIITTIAPVHLEFLGTLAKIADAKAEIFFGLEPGGAAVINRDIAQFAQLKRRAKEAGVARVISFGEHQDADARLIKCVLHPGCSTVQARILGTELTYKIGAPGRHVVINSLAVLAAADLVGADLALAALALADFAPVSGRGAPVEIGLSGGTALVLDESYNANPASMAAALEVLGRAPIGPLGRRIAVLGDMLELGPKGRALHRGLLDAVLANAIDLVFCCGPLMQVLWQALPASRRGGYAENSAALETQVLPAIRAGDAIMVKGSLGSRMAPIVKALQRAYPRHETAEDALEGAQG